MNAMLFNLLRWAIQAFWAFIPGCILLVTWEFLVHGDSRLEFLFATPSKVAAVAYQDLLSGDVLIDTAVTAGEAVAGLVIGSLCGTAIGLFLWTHERLAQIARPYIVILGAVPIFAIAPMLIIWFGTGIPSKIVMSMFSVFFVALSQAYDGARACSQEYRAYAMTLAAPHFNVVRKLIIPGALRWVAAGFKISIGLALVGAFIGEFVSSEAGLGHYILTAGSLYDMPRVIFGIILISLVALSLTACIWLGEKRWPHLFERNS
jgi:NitT/TauT family transport system permease protein